LASPVPAALLSLPVMVTVVPLAPIKKRAGEAVS